MVHDPFPASLELLVFLTGRGVGCFRSIPSFWRSGRMPAIPTQRYKQQDYSKTSTFWQGIYYPTLWHQRDLSRLMLKTYEVCLSCAMLYRWVSDKSTSSEPKSSVRIQLPLFKKKRACLRYKNQVLSTRELLPISYPYLQRNTLKNVPWSRMKVFLQTKIELCNHNWHFKR